MEFQLDPENFQSTSRSSSATAGRSGYDPAQVSSFINSAVTFMNDTDKAAARLEEIATQRRIAEAAQQAAIADYATMQGEATKAKVAVDAAAALRRKQILDNANINPDVMSSQINQAFRIINDTAATLEPLGREIDEKAAVGIFDNPLMYLVNQTRLPGMVGEYNAIAEQQNRAIETARNLQTLAASQQSISAAMDADKIAEAGRLAAAADAKAAQAKLAEVQQQAAGATQRDIANRLAMAGQKLDAQAQIVRFTKENQQMSMADRERQENAEALDLELQRVNDWLLMAGSKSQYNRAMWKSMPPAVRNRLVEYAGTGKIGTTLFGAVAAMEDVNGDLRAIANEGDAGAVNWLSRTRALADAKKADIVRITEAKGGKVSLKELPQQAFDLVQQQYDGENLDMSKASPSNPRKIDYVFATNNYKIAPSNRVISWLQEFGPAGKTPVADTVNEAVILDKLAADVVAGNITAAQAAKEVSEFYRMGVQVQAERTKYPIFGLEYVDKYIVKVPGDMWNPDRLAQPRGLDLTNPTAVETYLTKATARKIYSVQPLQQGLNRALPGVGIPATLMQQRAVDMQQQQRIKNANGAQ